MNRNGSEMEKNGDKKNNYQMAKRLQKNKKYIFTTELAPPLLILRNLLDFATSLYIGRHFKRRLLLALPSRPFCWCFRC